MFLQQVGNFRVPKDKKTSQKNCTTPLFLIQGTAKEYIDPTLTASQVGYSVLCPMSLCNLGAKCSISFIEGINHDVV